jgi:transcriptional/translational regulatory protein YebC/TACO1
VAYIPNNTVPVTDAAVAQAITKLQDSLDELDDVQSVFSNEETSED